MSVELDGTTLKVFLEAKGIDRAAIARSEDVKERFKELITEYDEFLAKRVNFDLIKFKLPDLASAFVPKNTYTFMVLHSFVVSRDASTALDVDLSDVEVFIAEEIIASQGEPSKIGILRARVFEEIVANPQKHIHALRSILSWALEAMDEHELGKHWRS
jgi:hypothetical protein